MTKRKSSENSGGAGTLKRERTRKVVQNGGTINKKWCLIPGCNTTDNHFLSVGRM